jgi:hypothetical protein
MPTDDDVEIDGADLAAELDDQPDPTLIDDGDEDDGDADLYDGPVHGGPWDGRHAQSRFPRGFLLIDRVADQVWIYDRGDDGAFTARSDTPMAVDDAKRWRAAEEDEYDILVPDVEMGQS